MPALNTDGSKFWAVIIAINEYKTSPLRGCVSDAKMVVEYLRDHLEVPEDHIELLLSGTDGKECTVPGSKPVSPGCDFAVDLTDEGVPKPTRENIVNAMFDLSINDNIKRDNNIIIYFAGHGTTYNCADYDGPGYKDNDAAHLGKIDALCPIDRLASTETTVTKGPPVPDISDREINTILAEIARKKGNHITFILDCCFSASLTRAPREGMRRRLIPSLSSSSIPDMFDSADQTLKDKVAGYQSIKDAHWKPNTDSHIILAACKEYEAAKEVKDQAPKEAKDQAPKEAKDQAPKEEKDQAPKKVKKDEGYYGVFTRALISTLENAAKSNGEPMTYYELIRVAGLKSQDDSQHPVIAGNREHRRQRLWFQGA